jgi:dipeptidyl-peptidase-4
MSGLRLRGALAALLVTACRADAPRPERDAPKRMLTLEQTIGRGEKVDFTGELPRIAWAPDGVHLERTEGERKTWIDPSTWLESEPPAPPPAEDDGVARALAAAGLPAEEVAKLAPRAKTRAPGGAVLVHTDGVLWWVAEGAARRLAGAAEGALELPELAPDGSRVAFVQANDLVVVETASGARQELTQDGGADVQSGKLDWVYQEELYGRGDFRGFWWSPDSRYVAFLRLDETKVHPFTLVDHVEEGHYRVVPEVTRYPKVGDPNPVVALGIAAVAEPARVRWVDISAHAADEPLVVRVDWAPSGTLLYMLQDRTQTWLELCAADPATAASRTLLRETSPGWVDRPETPRFLADGTFLLLSDRSGQRHVYRYRLDGTLVGAVTAGEWSVREIEHVDEGGGLVWFSASRDGALDGNAYRIGLDGAGLVRLTRAPGRHALSWNGARTLFLDRCSSLSEPPRLLLCDAEGEPVRELGAAQAPDLERYATRRWERLEIPARDGFALDAALLPPVGFDPARRYPVWLPTYSGPDAPSVTNAWNGSSWYQFLAQNGVMVLQVNVRSASGKGRAATQSCYRRLGVQELRDLEDALDWLVAHRSADPARVGISGGSYGGFMAAYALTHSGRFALGLAASGVYDWRLYDTIYTERYMATPERNPEGYAETSVVAAAGNLRGHLVITHGELDDNVHFQNAVHLVHAFQKAGQDGFELVLYPQSRHGLGDRDLRWFDRRLTWRVIREHLLGDGGIVRPAPG